jgi:hypothetical protein
MIIIFVAAFLIRLLALLALRDIHAGPTRTFGADGIEFNKLAHQVALGHGYELHLVYAAVGIQAILLRNKKIAGTRFGAAIEATDSPVAKML